MKIPESIRNAAFPAFCLLVSAALAGATPLVIPSGGAQANIGGCVLVNVNGIFFSNSGCTTPNIFSAGNPDTGSYAGLTGGTIQNLTGPPVVGNLPTPIVGFTTFNTTAGVINFDLVSTNPGYGTVAACFSNAIGNVCTPPGSPITLTQVTASSVSITLGLNGNAYLGSSSTGTSPTSALFTTQNLIPGTITGIIAQVESPSGFQDSYAAVYSSVAAPSTCPAIPLQALLGSWTFYTQGFFDPSQPFASAGVFTASLGTRGGSQITGILIFTDEISQNGYITNESAYQGSYTVFPDCSGGTLLFNLSANRMQFNFYFEKGGTEIVLVSTDSGDTVIGKAKLGPASACPANPLQALSGNWTFNADGFVSVLQPYAAAGFFNAALGTNRSGSTVGVLNITDTVNLAGQVISSAMGSGTYQILPDCSGGSLFFPSGSASFPRSFDFWFTSGDAEMYFVGTDTGVTVAGSAAHM